MPYWVDVGPLKVGRAAIYQGFSHGKDFAGTLDKVNQMLMIMVIVLMMMLTVLFAQ